MDQIIQSQFDAEAKLWWVQALRPKAKNGNDRLWYSLTVEEMHQLLRDRKVDA